MNKETRSVPASSIRRATDLLRKEDYRKGERLDQRLWKKIDGPCSLEEILNGLTKAELDGLRKEYAIPNLSACSKAELAKSLSLFIPVLYRGSLELLDQHRYELLQETARAGGFVEPVGYLPESIRLLRDAGLIFPVEIQNQKCVYMPPELVQAFTENDDDRMARTIARNTEWVFLAHGLVRYLGLVSSWDLMLKIDALTGADIQFRELRSVLDRACEFYRMMKPLRDSYCDVRLFDIKGLKRAWENRPELKDYPFRKSLLLRAGNTDNSGLLIGMKTLFQVMRNAVDLSDDDTIEIAYQLNGMINMKGSFEEIADYLKSWLSEASETTRRDAMNLLAEVHDNTRLWSLRGHTIQEVLGDDDEPTVNQQGNAELASTPLMAEFPSDGQPASREAVHLPHVKTGRNDPCPCGSGKKYKKCCGGG